MSCSLLWLFTLQSSKPLLNMTAVWLPKVVHNDSRDQSRFLVIKLDGVSPLITDPPQVNPTTMHSRLDRNLCLDLNSLTALSGKTNITLQQ